MNRRLHHPRQMNRRGRRRRARGPDAPPGPRSPARESVLKKHDVIHNAPTQRLK